MDPSRRATLEAAYAKLRESLEAKDVTADTLKQSALDALERAKSEIELEPQWVANELERIHTEATAKKPQK